ncbi:Membrane protein, putative [Pseudoalteromonas luteoviolacea B = ATCC 29581]|nr:Membrane protein, putative [Pseudoalteromonas luteoviolacea B = ATCC 29581]
MSGSLFALLDDIVFLTKVAASKTAPVLGDDLAVNAQSLSGDIRPERELAVVWAVAKGSLINKAVIVPVALLLSYFLPFLIQPLLMLGGAFLCYEGAHKLLDMVLPAELDTGKNELINAVSNCEIDLVQFENEKITSAIRMDSVLSAEIIVIALGSIQNEPLFKQFSVLVLIAVLMTIGVYGIVSLLVKLDDIALHLMREKENVTTLKYRLGKILLSAATRIMSSLSVIGMVACLLIGGEILGHNLHVMHEILQHIIVILPQFEAVIELVFHLVIGAVSGVILFITSKLFAKINSRIR